MSARGTHSLCVYPPVRWQCQRPAGVVLASRACKRLIGDVVGPTGLEPVAADSEAIAFQLVPKEAPAGYTQICAQIAGDAALRQVVEAWPNLAPAFKQAVLALVQVPRAGAELPEAERVGSPRTPDLEASLGPAKEGQGGAQTVQRRAAPSGGGTVASEPARSAVERSGEQYLDAAAVVRGAGRVKVERSPGARPQSAEAETQLPPPLPQGSARSGAGEQYLDAPLPDQHPATGLAVGADRFAAEPPSGPAHPFPRASAT